MGPVFYLHIQKYVVNQLKSMKFRYNLTFVLLCHLAAAQTQKITMLLNDAVVLENKIRAKELIVLDSLGNEQAKIVMAELKVVKPFSIKNDTLNYTTQHPLDEGDGYCIIEQKAALKDIKKVLKDRAMYFVTSENKVQITTAKKYDNGNTNNSKESADTFSTYIENVQNNEAFARALQKFFKKSGYVINIDYWYD